MADWASLLPELVQGIADRVLSTTGGVDTYMDMRAVCPKWRSAINRPSPFAVVADLHFRPRDWVMIELTNENYDDKDGCLFLHVPTGRFRRLRLPVLQGHLLIGVSDGLLVLGNREPLHSVCVLNPLTYDMLHFAAPLDKHFKDVLVMYTVVSVGFGSTLVLWTEGKSRVLCAHPTSDVFTEKDICRSDISMVTSQGNVYYACPDGRIFKIVGPAEQCYDDELIAQMSPDVDLYLEEQYGTRSELVESDGELLLVRHENNLALKVFKVNIEHKLLEEVKSLGGCRALFVGNQRCVSVDANKIPSVDGDCIYMSHWMSHSLGDNNLASEDDGFAMCGHNIRDGTMKIIASEPMLYIRPFSLVQVLLQ
jgi:hypothetical protein